MGICTIERRVISIIMIVLLTYLNRNFSWNKSSINIYHDNCRKRALCLFMEWCNSSLISYVTGHARLNSSMRWYWLTYSYEYQHYETALVVYFQIRELFCDFFNEFEIFMNYDAVYVNQRGTSIKWWGCSSEQTNIIC